MLNNLKELCMLNGASGNEGNVCRYIISKIKNKADYKVDKLGNLIVFKKGKKTPKNKVMLAAHMDEVGLIITSVREDGTLTFSEVGGVDASVVIGRQVLVGDKLLSGVIGSKAVHKLSGEEREKAPQMSSLYIDIGAIDKEDALKNISCGDYVHFYSEYCEFGDEMIRCKAIDDRFGCAAMIELINSDLEFDSYFVFTVQEELGLRGARTASYALQPDFAIVLETTTAADISGVCGAERVCELGKGAVISYMDKSTMYDRELYNMAFNISGESSIQCQTKSMVAGGNDSGAIHVSGVGVRTLAVSAPCRYLHSPSCTVKKSDLLACLDITKELINRISML